MMPASEKPMSEERCATCGGQRDATVHNAKLYRRVPGGYGHPFAEEKRSAPAQPDCLCKEQPSQPKVDEQAVERARVCAHKLGWAIRDSINRSLAHLNKELDVYWADTFEKVCIPHIAAFSASENTRLRTNNIVMNKQNQQLLSENAKLQAQLKSTLAQLVRTRNRENLALSLFTHGEKSGEQFYEMVHQEADALTAGLQAQLAQLREVATECAARLRDGAYAQKEIEIAVALEKATVSSTDWLSTKLREAKAEALREAAEIIRKRAEALLSDFDRLRARAEELSKSNQGGSDEGKDLVKD